MKPFHAETEALRAVSTVPPITTNFWENVRFLSLGSHMNPINSHQCVLKSPSAHTERGQQTLDRVHSMRGRKMGVGGGRDFIWFERPNSYLRRKADIKNYNCRKVMPHQRTTAAMANKVNHSALACSFFENICLWRFKCVPSAKYSEILAGPYIREQLL